MLLDETLKLDYSDVLIRPKRSELTSRFDVVMEKNYTFKWSGKPLRCMRSYLNTVLLPVLRECIIRMQNLG